MDPRIGAKGVLSSSLLMAGGSMSNALTNGRLAIGMVFHYDVVDHCANLLVNQTRPYVFLT